MGMQIESGDHKSNNAIVSNDGRLYTTTVARSPNAVTSETGFAYCISCADLTLTTVDTWHAIVYIKNTSSRNMYISTLIAGGTNDIQMKQIKKPTSGTLITGGTELTPENLNFASGQPFNGQVLLGGEGYTITDGQQIGQSYIGQYQTTFFDFQGSIIVSRNTSIAVSVYNTVNPTDVSVNFLVYFNGEE